MIEQRAVLLVPFPFSDQSGRKVRPVVVISNEDFNRYSDDILVIGLTSNLTKDKYSLDMDNNDLEEGKLFTKCYIKVENILKIDKELVLKKIGRIKKEKFSKTINILLTIIKE